MSGGDLQNSLRSTRLVPAPSSTSSLTRVKLGVVMGTPVLEGGAAYGCFRKSTLAHVASAVMASFRLPFITYSSNSRTLAEYGVRLPKSRRR